MADSIREQILTAIGERLVTLRKSNQYNSDLGKQVARSHLPPIDSSLVPCVGYHVEQETNEDLYHRKEVKIMPVRVQGVAAFGSVKPPIMAERIYADICECVLSDQFTLGFDSGGTAEISAGDTITGQTSAAAAMVISISLDSGTWAGGDAAGTFTLRRLKGTFANNEEIKVGAVTGMATVDGTQSGQDSNALAGGGLSDAMTFYTGAITMPEADGSTVGVSIIFNVRYKQISGNPYSQT